MIQELLSEAIKTKIKQNEIDAELLRFNTEQYKKFFNEVNKIFVLENNFYTTQIRLDGAWVYIDVTKIPLELIKDKKTTEGKPLTGHCGFNILRSDHLIIVVKYLENVCKLKK